MEPIKEFKFRERIIEIYHFNDPPIPEHFEVYITEHGWIPYMYENLESAEYAGKFKAHLMSLYMRDEGEIKAWALPEYGFTWRIFTQSPWHNPGMGTTVNDLDQAKKMVDDFIEAMLCQA